MKRRNAGKDEIPRKSAKPSEPTTKPKASKAPKAQTECMTVWRHARRRSASRDQGQPNIQSHTFDWDSQARTNSTSLAPAIARSNTSHEGPSASAEKLCQIDLDSFDSGTESVHSDYFALGPEYGQHGSSFHRMPRDARSSRGVSRSSHSKMYSPMMLDGMRDAQSPLPYVTPPLQRPRRITLHGSSLSSPVYDRQNHELPNYSDPWVPHARASLKRRRCITLHGDPALPFSSNDLSWRSQPSHYLPNDSNSSNMSAPPSLFAASIPSVSAFSPGSVYNASETSLQSPPTMSFPSIPQTSFVDVYDTASSSLHSYSSHGPSPITEMGQYCGSFTSPNLDNPWGIPAGSLSALSSPPSFPSLINPSDNATGQLIHGARHSTDCDQLFLHNRRNPYSAGNQVNHDISPQGAPPFSSSSSYTSENHEPYQLPLDYNPILQTASSDLHYSPGLQNALQLEFGTTTLDLSNIDMSETGPLDPELLLMDFYVPQNNE
ncbi:uncharacterized protein ARMOST_05879 [Armillaria ostoyae]|uniref:Uncharacterized protein n=1 Tax=Armillaria ostoyae TaxID=47428 RepID=A0A284R1G7_ARMOS|nr:uncharacterized protein ARMOST_05879 [Armillaria ostoyae]